MSPTAAATTPTAAGREANALAAGVPALLIPMRIETRFVDTVGSELLVRVYPDTISISSFEPELTQDEINAGQAYWNAIWQAGNPPQNTDSLQAPWRVLAAAYQPQRAAWIAATMTPTNLSSQPAAPAPAGNVPSPPPAFPSPPQRPTSYEQAPIVAALPDAWTVFLYSGSTVSQFTGSPIQQNLAVGLKPNDGTLSPGLPVDSGMAWLVDFDQAVNVGMGIRISLNATQRASGFDRVVVLGLRDGNSGQPGNAVLAALLDAHHYTDGLAFVPQGAPTKNTADAASAYSSKDPNYDVSFRVERGTALTAASDADGPQTANLLGIPVQTFDHIQFADSHGVRNGRNMLTALWPATLGYFMDQMLSPVFAADAIEEARQYALTNAVPRGALPALRAGKMPYGILPVTSLAAYPQPERIVGVAAPENLLVGFLKLLLPLWQSSITAVPQVGGSGDPDQDLVHILGMDASSMTFRARQVIGDEAMWNILQFLGLPDTSVEEWWIEHLVRGRALLDSLGLTSWDPRVIHTSMGRTSYPVPYPTVQAGPLSETDPLNNDAAVAGNSINYIQWLRTASLADIQNENYPGPKPTALLYRILRQSVLREYVTLAGQAQVNAGLLQISVLREAELVNVRQASPSTTPWDIVQRPITANSAVTWAQYLHDLQPAPASPFARLANLRTSFDDLAVLPTAELDRLLTETLDACSHRLDVWVTAVANAILQRQRSSQTAPGTPALHLGGYGWVENVRPAARRAVVTGAEATAVARLDDSRKQDLPAAARSALQPVMQPQTDNGGFIHAPSMTQAAAAAVLRSGYMTHQGTPDAPALAIDLTSERTKLALWVLEGVRHGQTLSALTGYSFEEALHEASLDVYIQPFRDSYPLIGNDLTPQSSPSEVVAPSQIVDGLKLRTAWQAGNLSAGADWGAGLPPPAPLANAVQNQVLGFITAIDDMMSALGDLSMAESVYQIMRGNFGRAGGLLDAISRGDHPPPPDIVDTPRSGLDVTHRLMLLFAESPPAQPAWGVPVRPRSLVEPYLDAWLASRLPDPATVRCVVSFAVGGSTQPSTVSLHDLGIGPLDLLALADAGDQPQRSELENRILYQAAPPAGAANFAISYAAAGLAAGSVPFPDVLLAARTLRDMLYSARPVEPETFDLPQNNSSAGAGATDIGELSGRAAALNTKLGTDIASLQAAIANIGSAPQAVNAALLAASAYGVTGSTPQIGIPTADLATQANAVLGQLQSRQNSAQQALTSASLPNAAADDVLAVIQAILGKGVLAMPHITAPNATALQGAFAQSAAMCAVDPQALDRWLLQLSHIRPAVARFDQAMSVTQLLGAPRATMLALAQLPATPNDRWLGLPIDPANPPTQGRVAIEALTIGDPTTPSPLAGLLLDEWLDRIPNSTENAGVSFHFEEPKARAPQALLLAVCPDVRPSWDLTLLRTILEETLNLAKIRAVDLDSIQQAGQILPGLYFPFNLQGATPATNFVAVEAVNAAANLLKG